MGILFLYLLLWAVVGIFGSFVLWRRIKEDYLEHEAIELVTRVTVSSLILGLLVRLIFVWIRVPVSPQFGASAGVDLWGVLLAGYAAIIWSHKKLKWWWGEALDGFMEAVLWGSLVVALLTWGTGLWALRVDAWLYVVLSIGGVITFYWLKKRYRSFHWYESGRVGFVFWIMVILLAIVRLIDGLVTIPGWQKLVVCLMYLLLLGWGIFGGYRLSARSWKKDWKSIDVWSLFH